MMMTSELISYCDRNYLMKFITPILGEGLLQISEVLPEDPVDFLVRFEIKYNLIIGRLSISTERVLNCKASIVRNK